MASFVTKHVNGHSYLQIVQSKRINGKPHAVVLEHLGNADTLLKRLQEQNSPVIEVKSYSHGLVAALLQEAEKLEIVEILNRHACAARPYFARKPLRNGCTVGCALLLAAIGRVCRPCSKMAWADWAEGTSLAWLLKTDIRNYDSQHFWDMMDSFPAERIDDAYEEILKKAKELYDIDNEIILYDTTNFFTYISSDNDRCGIARRGKNKQKRCDLRQVGLAMSVTRSDFIPLFFDIYEGNRNDTAEFSAVYSRIRNRLAGLGFGPGSHTLVFDRGCNSKKLLAEIGGEDENAGFYVGALSPCHHMELMREAMKPDAPREHVQLGNMGIDVFRDRREIWGRERTVLVYVSAELRKGKLTEMQKAIDRAEKKLQDENTRLSAEKSRKFSEEEMKKRVDGMVKMKGALQGLVCYEFERKKDVIAAVKWHVDSELYNRLADESGYRIVMTNHHDWKSLDIIKCYHGQNDVEHSFHELKNPWHIAVRPEFHWTDQKIKVHMFCCVIGFLLVSLIWKKLRSQKAFVGWLDNALEKLSSLRLAACSVRYGDGKPELTYKWETMSLEELTIINTLGILNYHETCKVSNSFWQYKKES